MRAVIVAAMIMRAVIMPAVMTMVLMVAVVHTMCLFIDLGEEAFKEPLILVRKRQLGDEHAIDGRRFKARKLGRCGGMLGEFMRERRGRTCRHKWSEHREQREDEGAVARIGRAANGRRGVFSHFKKLSSK